MPQGDVGLLIKGIHEQLEKRANLMLRQFDLTLTQTRVLFYLHDHQGEKTTPKDIEDYFGVTHPTVVGLLQRLEGKGFIVSEPDEGDRRCRVVRLAADGPLDRVLCKMPPESMEPMLTRGLTPAEIAQLRRSLEIVYQNVQEL